MTGRKTASRAPTPGAPDTRIRTGWTIAVLIALAVLAVWLTDLHLPLGDSDDGRILARFGLSARNFWELGPAESGFGARVDPYIRGEFAVQPGTTPPEEAVTYAHHPPLHTFITIVSVGLLGDSPAALRIVGFLLGASTILFLAGLGRILGIAWGPILVAVFHEPARAATILQQVTRPRGLMWVGHGIPTARWASYYLEVPVCRLEERHLDDVGPDDLALPRTDRMPDNMSPPTDSIVEDGRCRLVSGDAVRNR